MSQKDELLKYLRTHAEVTPLDALRDLGIYRLAARVHDLRADGCVIACSEPDEKGKRHAIYSLVSEGVPA